MSRALTHYTNESTRARHPERLRTRTTRTTRCRLLAFRSQAEALDGEHWLPPESRHPNHVDRSSAEGPSSNKKVLRDALQREK
jgi:hypothetical protein